jgi:VanZ family protein
LNRRTSGLISIALAVALVVVGLWPFDFRPLNRVNWLENRAGLSFRPNGIAYAPDTADWSGGGPSERPPAFTLELWLEPGHVPATDLFDIVTIDDGVSPPGIMLFQWRTELDLRVRDRPSRRGFREVGPSGFLTAQTPRFVTIVVDPTGTTFYSNGARLEFYPGFTVPNSALHGRLLLGDAAAGKHPWSGNLFGLAIYHRAMDAAEVAQHYTLWTNQQAGQLAAESSLTALYRLDEGHGPWVSDLSTNRHRLLIPERYEVLRKRVLELPWGPDPVGLSEVDDIAINILGFVPFGFMVYCFRRLAKPDGRGGTIVWAICAGAAVSLVIELIQVWLPDRTSSVTDLFSNTLGTLLGALIARGIAARIFPAGNAGGASPN